MKRVLLLLLAGCTTAPATAPLDPDTTAEVAAAAETSVAKTAQMLNQALNRKREAGPGCLSDLVIEPARMCEERYAKHVLVAWDACPVLGGSSTGKIDINNALDTIPAGTPCDDASRYQVNHSSTYDFVGTRASGDVHETNVAVNAGGEFHFEGPPPGSIFADVSVLAKGPNYDVAVTGEYDTLWDESTIPATVIMNGHTNVHLDRLNHDYDVDADGLTVPGDCCHPTAGTVDVTIQLDQTLFQRSVQFGPECGEATMDGEPIQLHPCASLN